MIHKIRDNHGDWISDKDKIVDALVHYYKDLFTLADMLPRDSATNTIPKVINAEMNSKLSTAFSEWEVKKAIKQMAPLKAPGPDGMSPLFLQHYWDLIGDDVSHSFLHFLNTASFPENLNHTFITLIPKKKNPEFASDFRPISLCNVFYKIFSEVQENRLKRILPNIISEHQSTFNKSRLIYDNILVAFESLHSMQKHKGKEDFMAIKLDMSKAYNRVEWHYLESIMVKMGSQIIGSNCSCYVSKLFLTRSLLMANQKA